MAFYVEDAFWAGGSMSSWGTRCFSWTHSGRVRKSLCKSGFWRPDTMNWAQGQVVQRRHTQLRVSFRDKWEVDSRQVVGATQTWLQLWVRGIFQGQGWDKTTYIWPLNSSFWSIRLKLHVWACTLSMLHWQCWLLPIVGYLILGEPIGTCVLKKHLSALTSNRIPLLFISECYCIYLHAWFHLALDCRQCLNIGIGFRYYPSGGNVASCPMNLANGGRERSGEGQMMENTVAI